MTVGIQVPIWVDVDEAVRTAISTGTQGVLPIPQGDFIQGDVQFLFTVLDNGSPADLTGVIPLLVIKDRYAPAGTLLASSSTATITSEQVAIACSTATVEMAEFLGNKPSKQVVVQLLDTAPTTPVVLANTVMTVVNRAYAADDNMPIYANQKHKTWCEPDDREPTVTDDETDGYGVGSIWVWCSSTTESDKIWICYDATTDAADWRSVSQLGATGVQGSIGYQGYQGTVGGGGTQGPQGAVGSVGTQGAQGNVGLQGAVGDTGAQGDVGAQGVVGLQGAVGLQGDIGFQGAVGAGVQGPEGIQGDIGTNGVQGYQGYQGDVGIQGLQGDTGVQGLAGSQGIAGLQGAVGDTGAQGLIGPQGLQGLVGVQGTTGDTGAQGDVGPQGDVGIDGVQGYQGSGIQGYQGDFGPQGLQGSYSPATGPQVPWRVRVISEGFQDGTAETVEYEGTQGPQGLQGDTAGPQGYQGYQGLDASGLQGPQGSGLGPQGPQGYQGAETVGVRDALPAGTPVDIDFSGDDARTKAMTANTTFTYSNPTQSRVIYLELSGNYTPTFPASNVIIQGTYNGAVTNYIFICCVDAATPTYVMTISQEL